MSNRIDQAIRDAEGAVDKVTSTTHTHAIGVDEHKECQACHDQAEAAMMPTTQALEGLEQAVENACAEIDKLREDKQTCVLMLRALYAWLDGIGDGAPDASALQKEALWRCATITEVLEKVGEL